MSQEIIARILRERERQFDLPGIEYDVKNTPNDWQSLCAHFLFNDIRRGPLKPTRESYEDSLGDSTGDFL